MHLALSDPSLSESERLDIIKKSAKTLKEYGQDAEWPDGELPLKKLMDENFEQCKEQMSEMSAWTLHLENESLEQKMKLINAIQIEVVEDQIKMLIPGSTPIQLSSDVISLCKKTPNIALFSFLKQSIRRLVDSLVSETSKVLSLTFSYQRLKNSSFLADTN